MTDRERFEANAINHGVTVLEKEATKLTIVSLNGFMVTTYIFDDNGKFLRLYH